MISSGGGGGRMFPLQDYLSIRRICITAYAPQLSNFRQIITEATGNNLNLTDKVLTFIVIAHGS